MSNSHIYIDMAEADERLTAREYVKLRPDPKVAKISRERRLQLADYKAKYEKLLLLKASRSTKKVKARRRCASPEWHGIRCRLASSK